MESRRTKLLQILIGREARIDAHLSSLETLEKRFVWIRLSEVLVGAAVSIALFTFDLKWLGWGVLVIALGSFVYTAYRHNHLVRRMQEWKIFRQTVSRQKARMNLAWEEIPLPNRDQPGNLHPFEHDLNLVGEHSLLHLLDTAVSIQGSQRLRDWLLNLDPDPDQVRTRQKFIQELIPLTGFRSRLAIQGALVLGGQNEGFDGDWLIAWLQGKFVQKELGRLLMVLAAFSILNIGLFVLNALAWLPPVWILSVIVYVFVYQYHYKKYEDVFSEASQLESVMQKLRGILTFLETYRAHPGSQLEALCKPFTNPKEKPSRFLRRLSWVVTATSLKYNPPFWLIVNLFVPWDLYFAYRLEGQKKELKDRLPAWLDRWYEIEALHALANFAFLNPDYVFPDVTEGLSQPVFSAQNLGHPLILRERRISNDFSIQQTGEVALVTGSNMSGKSTFLRTVGINQCLAFAGAPVAASQYQTIPFRLFTCINIMDSLADGISYFYAEVRQLKRLLVELGRDHPTPVLFLIDEIFRGTNNRERQIGSRAYVRALAGGRGAGLISTHDLELVSLTDEVPHIFLYHFQETVTEDRMVFEYRLRNGPSETTNALKIMEIEGLPVK